jgi:RNA recognition motif-containing protein
LDLGVLFAARPFQGWRLFLSGTAPVTKEIRKMEAKLYVGNLSYATSEDDLRTLFAQAGTVVSAAVITDRDTGNSKGFGFVEMTSQVDAQKAISMFNAYKMGERALTVNMAKPREPRSDRGGSDNRYRGF